MAASELIAIDGSEGEGGGQILRTSLALSIITGRPFAMRAIRAGRAKPGLRRQHLTCVEAAARVGQAAVRGAEVGSKYLEFVPRAATTEPRLEFDIGTAGSTTLVVQTVLVPLIQLAHRCEVRVIGGTHNPMAPTFDFLDRVFVPHLRAMGARVELRLDRHGFAGNTSGSDRRFYDHPTHDRGALVVTVEPGTLQPIEVIDAAPISERHACALLARLPTHVAERELAIVRKRLEFAARECEVRAVDSDTIANLLMIEVTRADGHRELVTSHGEKGLRAEVVAERACDELARYLAAGVPVGGHLADQLLLPLAVAGGGAFRTLPLSRHATTNIATIGKFLELPITTTEQAGATVVKVGA